jgi:hypothetical protein
MLAAMKYSIVSSMMPYQMGSRCACGVIVSRQLKSVKAEYTKPISTHNGSDGSDGNAAFIVASTPLGSVTGVRCGPMR